MILKLEDIHTFYGKSQILHGISLEIEKGEIVGLLGRNGVGKSTTLKSIIGLVQPQRGSIRFKEKEIMGLKPFQICRSGLGYVPEERRIFPNLTVRENLMIGIKPKYRVDDPWTIDKIYSLFPKLGARDRQKGGNLSGGEQQMLSIGRTLMGNPELLLVDEPTEGLAPIVVEMVSQTIRRINEDGSPIILVEHALDVALSLANRAYIMAKGEIVFHGTCAEIQGNDEIRKKYIEVS